MRSYQNPNSDKSKMLTGLELAEVYKGYIEKYDIVSIEDPFDQDDWEAWTALNTSSKVQIVGDDLTVTNPLRIKTAIEKKACNALLLKVSRSRRMTRCADSVRSTKSVPSPSLSRRASEIIEQGRFLPFSVQLSQSNGWGIMTSHRSGETESTYIADLAVGLKTG